MKILKEERYVLNIIKFGPIIFVIFFAFFITQALIYEKNINFKKEIKLVEKTYLDNNKKRVKSEVEKVYREINEEKKSSIEFLREELRDRVYEAHNVATNIYNDNKDLSDKKHTFKIIKNALGSIIFNNGRGYYFINDAHGYNLLQPLNKKIENTYILEKKDVTGYYFAKAIVQSIKDKNERFDTYYWYKNSKEDKAYKKIAFYKYFEPYNVAIGTGEYIDDFENEIKKRVLNRINKIRFNKSGYIFIFDSKANTLSHFDKSKIGINRINEKNNNDRYVVRELIDFAKKNKEGFTSYTLDYKPDEKDEYRNKISYLKYFKEWDWIIGSGFYLDNLNKQIEERKVLLNESKDKSIKQIIFISIVVTILFGLLSFYISRIMTRKLIDYKRNLETKIKENLEQKITLLEAQEVANIGNWKWDHVNNKCEYSNVILRIFGIHDKKVELSPLYIKTILLEEDSKKFDIFLQNCIYTTKQNKEVVRIQRENGNIKWVEVRGKLDTNRNIVIGTLQDITDNKNLEIEKKQQEELLYQQSKLAAMGEMLGNIAHQWRQPLSVISTAATGAKLQKEMNTLEDENFIHTMDSINESAQYLSQTIEDFKGFFDPKNSISKEFHISKTINKALKLISSQFTSLEIKIIQNIEDTIISSHENELIQVLLNILNNAKDALLDINDTNKYIFINSFKNDQYLFIEIKDNAKGIKKEIINRVFEPYFTTKHQTQGTGIGLYMSQDITTKLLKGSIKVENEKYTYDGKKYKGAKFLIQIPLKK